jgi:hypothetical protein
MTRHRRRVSTWDVEFRFAAKEIFPSVADHVRARDGCRAGLEGNLVTHEDEMFRISSSKWYEGRLLLYLDAGDGRVRPVYGSRCFFATRWICPDRRASGRIMRAILTARESLRGKRGKPRRAAESLVATPMREGAAR